jgi:uncharacterized membrane protein YtjA (UPF0391 family)
MWIIIFLVVALITGIIWLTLAVSDMGEGDIE